MKPSNTEIYNRIINIKSKVNNPINNVERISVSPIQISSKQSENKLGSDSKGQLTNNISGFDQFNKNNKVLMTTVKDLKSRLQKSNNLSTLKNNDSIHNAVNERNEIKAKLEEIKNKLQLSNKTNLSLAGKKK